MYNYGLGSTAGGFMGNLGAFGPVGNVMRNIAPNAGNSQYMNQGYLPTFGMEAQQNPGPMPLGGLVGGIAGRTVASMGNMGGLGLAGQIAGQFNDPMTIKKVY